MSAFDAYSREQLRLTLTQAWGKHLGNVPLTPLEALISDVIVAHPEYQSLAADKDAALAFEHSAGGTENPFMHLGLHLAVREQLAIDRPPGIRDLHRRMEAQLGSTHDAEHALMEALGETLWQAQCGGAPPDEKQYLALAEKRLKRFTDRKG